MDATVRRLSVVGARRSGRFNGSQQMKVDCQQNHIRDMEFFYQNVMV